MVKVVFLQTALKMKATWSLLVKRIVNLNDELQISDIEVHVAEGKCRT